MKAYQNILRNVLEKGTPKQPVRFDSEGNPVPVENGTIGTFCEVFRHDMSEGFPLLTTKKMAFRSMCVELEGFIKGVTDKKWFQERKCKFWSEWSNPQKVQEVFDAHNGTLSKREIQETENDLGPIYGFQFRGFGGYSYKLQYTPKKYNHSRYPSWKPKYKIVNKHTHEIIEDCGSDDQNRPLVFVKCGSGYKKTVRKDHAQKVVKDPYCITVCDIGYLGEINKIKNDHMYSNLKKTWSHMMERCYNKKCKEYKYYGEKGVYVCDKWHCFANFYKDVQVLTGYVYKQRDPNNYSLDKDHFSSNVYSPETCVWLPKEMNTVYANLRFFNACDPEGNYYYHISPARFACEHDLDAGKINACLRGERKSHKGWIFKTDKDKGLRFSLPFDQLKSIADKLKENPYDRRMVCSAWNPSEIPFMALPACHVLSNVVVYGNKLNLVWNQRSCDLFLGIPMNIASYGLLLLLLAKHSGLEPGELVGTLHDCHLYENQIEQAKIQLKRTPLKLPTVRLTHDGDIFNWTHEDIVLDNYACHDKIAAEVTV